ncbi:DUF4554 domain-containing protein isoform X1 [Alosa sapidissima]|uniref:DUF4554 domain-containing protein isoform X1 n=1 Tax=Alosa sapidissima TaxID=34773 RepID=UPI001C088C54|nr:DUF4554 domain-containing protein isoform X1 [Alosa sapidissima]
MEMIKEIYKVVRFLMRVLDRPRKYSTRKDSDVLVLLCATKSHPSDKLTCTIAAAGPWAPSNPIEKVLNESLSLLERISYLPASASTCRSVDTEELSLFVKSSGPVHFVVAFEMAMDNKCWQQEKFYTEAFLRRISLVRAQMKIFFKFKDNGETNQHVFGDGVKSKMLVNNQSIIMDSTSYQLCPFSEGGLLPCDQIHAVVGAKVPLQLPFHMVLTGLGGETSIITMAALGPCMEQYPNWPIRLTTIQILVYSPSSMPRLESNMATPMSFLQSLAGRLAWEDLGLSGVTCADLQQAEGEAPGSRGPLCWDMVFNVKEREEDQGTESKWNQTVKQTLTLYLLLQHTDPFHSQFSDLIVNEEMFEKHLDQVLWHNSERVTASLQSLLEKTLKPHQKKCSNQRKMQAALPVVLSSLTSVVNSSSSAEFRTTCLDKMKVPNTHQLSVSLDQLLHSITGSRFTPLHRCTTNKPRIGTGPKPSFQRPEGEDEAQVLTEGETDHQDRIVSSAAKRQKTAPSADEDWLQAVHNFSDWDFFQ